MIRNYLKIALRNLSRNRLYSMVSIAGFTIGLTIVLHIALFIKNEMTYDSFNKNSKNIYRAVINSGETSYGSISPFIAEKLKDFFPQIKLSCRYYDKETELKINGRFVKGKISLADDSFFRMFSFNIIDGSTYAFGKNPNEIFVTKSFSEKYFGTTNSRGRIISVRLEDKFYDFIIGGVTEDAPSNSSIKFNILITFIQTEKTYWNKAFNEDGIDMGETYPSFFVLLNNKKDRPFIEKEFTAFIYDQVKQKYVNPDYSLELTPLEDIHFRENVKFSTLESASKTPVYILSIIGIIILIIVSFNYINLTITHSSHRFKEVGIRKTAGASRKEIVLRFLSESFLVIIISLLFSTGLAELTAPVFYNLVGFKQAGAADPVTYALLIFIIALLVSLAAGSYPAIIMSRPNPSSVLKGNEKLSGPKSLSKIFIAVQFVMAIMFISAAIIINKQYNYWMYHDSGFVKEGVIVVKASEMFGRHITPSALKLFKDEITKNSSVISASGTEINLGEHDNIGDCRFDYKGKMVFSRYMLIDENFFNTLGIKIIRGRNFSNEMSADSADAVIVNQAFVKALTLKDPLNEPLTFLGQKGRFKNIIGVVKDFNYFSLKEELIPMAFRLAKDDKATFNIYIKYSTGSLPVFVDYLQSTWNKLIPDYSFDYKFLDESIANQYKTEQRWKDIINYSSAVAIFFAVLGMFALVLYSAERRTKEIGIRKILGASTINIIRLLVKEYVIIIAVALIAGCTITYYLAGYWLENFAYKIVPGIETFLYPVVIVVSIAALTLLVVTYRAAKSKPADSLRYE